ncbi:ABC transporter ATP-binding protein [Rhodopseudomonas palustris]|uniref:ABC transporter related n=1 Tax=Rhodopseudomonas palustris (strain BisB18) TaxID=316056 RepID=Q217E6_RHOPB
MLRFSDVGFVIDGGLLLASLNLVIAPHDIVVMVGRSGIGKTTALRLAAGLERVSSGALDNSFARTAMVFQEPRLLPWASALDNVALALEGGDRSRLQRRELAAQWLRRLGFDAADLSKHPLQLSGGMQARVAIARALVTKPDLILMDEPFAALDLALRRDLQALTRALCSETGAAVLFVTHDLAEAVCLADRIVVISGAPGTITAELPQRPASSLSEMWSAVAELSRRAEITAAFEPA